MKKIVAIPITSEGAFKLFLSKAELQRVDRTELFERETQDLSRLGEAAKKVKTIISNTDLAGMRTPVTQDKLKLKEDTIQEFILMQGDAYKTPEKYTELKTRIETLQKQRKTDLIKLREAKIKEVTDKVPVDPLGKEWEDLKSSSEKIFNLVLTNSGVDTSSPDEVSKFKRQFQRYQTLELLYKAFDQVTETAPVATWRQRREKVKKLQGLKEEILKVLSDFPDPDIQGAIKYGKYHKRKPLDLVYTVKSLFEDHRVKKSFDLYNALQEKTPEQNLKYEVALWIEFAKLKKEDISTEAKFQAFQEKVKKSINKRDEEIAKIKEAKTKEYQTVEGRNALLAEFKRTIENTPDNQLLDAFDAHKKSKKVKLNEINGRTKPERQAYEAMQKKVIAVSHLTEQLQEVDLKIRVAANKGTDGNDRLKERTKIRNELYELCQEGVFDFINLRLKKAEIDSQISPPKPPASDSAKESTYSQLAVVAKELTVAQEKVSTADSQKDKEKAEKELKKIEERKAQLEMQLKLEKANQERIDTLKKDKIEFENKLKAIHLRVGSMSDRNPEKESILLMQLDLDRKIKAIDHEISTIQHPQLDTTDSKLQDTDREILAVSEEIKVVEATKKRLEDKMTQFNIPKVDMNHLDQAKPTAIEFREAELKLIELQKKKSRIEAQKEKLETRKKAQKEQPPASPKSVDMLRPETRVYLDGLASELAILEKNQKELDSRLSKMSEQEKSKKPELLLRQQKYRIRIKQITSELKAGHYEPKEVVPPKANAELLLVRQQELDIKLKELMGIKVTVSDEDAVKPVQPWVLPTEVFAKKTLANGVSPNVFYIEDAGLRVEIPEVLGLYTQSESKTTLKAVAYGNALCESILPQLLVQAGANPDNVADFKRNITTDIQSAIIKKFSTKQIKKNREYKNDIALIDSLLSSNLAQIQTNIQRSEGTKKAQLMNLFAIPVPSDASGYDAALAALLQDPNLKDTLSRKKEELQFVLANPVDLEPTVTSFIPAGKSEALTKKVNALYKLAIALSEKDEAAIKAQQKVLGQQAESIVKQQQKFEATLAKPENQTLMDRQSSTVLSDHIRLLQAQIVPPAVG